MWSLRASSAVPFAISFCGADLDVMDLHPLMMPVKRKAGQKVFLHPSALLLALLASAYFHSNEIVGEHASTGHEFRGSSLLSLLSEKIAIVAAMALAATWLEHQASSALTFLEADRPLFHGSPDENTAHVTTTPHEAQVDDLSQFFHSIGFGTHQSALSQHTADLLAARGNWRQRTGSFFAGAKREFGADVGERTEWWCYRSGSVCRERGRKVPKPGLVP